MCAAKLLKRNKNNNVAVALVTTERSRNGHPCCNAGGAPEDGDPGTSGRGVKGAGGSNVMNRDVRHDRDLGHVTSLGRGEIHKR